MIETTSTNVVVPLNPNKEERLPGDLVTHRQDHDALGIIISRDGIDLNVFWTRVPVITIESQLKQQVLDEIDADILRDLNTAASIYRQCD